MHQMPVGIEEWRAGIVYKRPRRLIKGLLNIPVLRATASVLHFFTYLYLFVWKATLLLPFAVMIESFLSCLIERRFRNLEKFQDPLLNCIKIYTYVLVRVYFMVLSLIEVFISNFGQSLKCLAKYKMGLMIMQSIEYILLIARLLDSMSLGHLFPLNFLLLLSGDIHLNPGPQNENQFKFFHWNLNSICARSAIKIPLIED